MPAYDEDYLDQNRKITEFLFSELMKSGHDFFQAVYEYMTTSDIRRKMDEGNWSALNKGINQIMHSFDLDRIPSGRNDYMDETISAWMADIYVYLQWKYDLYSSVIVQRMPPEKLAGLFNPLHEASIRSGAEKIYNHYIRESDS